MKKLISIVTVVFMICVISKTYNDFLIFKKKARITLGYIIGPNFESRSKTETGMNYYFKVGNKKYTGMVYVNSRLIDKIPSNQKVLVLYDSTNIESNTALFDVDLTKYNELGTILDSIFYHKIDNLTIFNSGF